MSIIPFLIALSKTYIPMRFHLHDVRILRIRRFVPVSVPRGMMQGYTCRIGASYMFVCVPFTL